MVIASATQAQAQNVTPVLLKTPVAFATTLPGPGSTIKWIADRIDVASSGNIKMRLYEPNNLIAPFEILDAVSSGKVNAGYATASHWAGKMPAAGIFSAVPFGPEAGEYLAWLWYGNGMKLYQKMYDQAGYDVKVMVCGILPPRSSGWFADEVNRPDDLRDLKMR
ncbi:MAG: C4-dicarboxylate ABC transporter, partial [Gammaproteobacteria bacterium]|nr:C4-dicarboxylate ABC transporter [Gammaproteobacteria bacterium]